MPTGRGVVHATNIPLPAAVISTAARSWLTGVVATTNASCRVALTTATDVARLATTCPALHTTDELSIGIVGAALPGFVATERAAHLLRRTTDTRAKTLLGGLTADVISAIVEEGAAPATGRRLRARAAEVSMHRAALSIPAFHASLTAVVSARFAALLIAADLN